MRPDDHVAVDVNVTKGGSISKIEISPKGTYLIAAILQNDLFHTIVGWEVEDIEKGKDIGWKDEEVEGIEQEDEQVKDEKDLKRNSIDVELNNKTKTHICVSDDKILAYVDDDDGRFHINDFSKYC
jgi:hypothetical protein